MHLRIYLEATSKRTGRTRIVPGSERELEVDDSGEQRVMTKVRRKGLAATSGLKRPGAKYPAWRAR